MADFPTLTSKGWSPVSWKPGGYSDIVSKSDAGYKKTRQRFTRDPKTHSFKLKMLTAGDYALLTAFWDAQRKTGNFNFTHPITGATLDVRFKSEFELKHDGTGHWYCERIVFEEV